MLLIHSGHPGSTRMTPTGDSRPYVGRGELQVPNCMICADRGYILRCVFRCPFDDDDFQLADDFFMEIPCPGCNDDET